MAVIEVAVSDLDSLNGGINNTATSITLDDATSFPTGYFVLKLYKADGSQSPEGVLISSRSGNVLTVASSRPSPELGNGRGYIGSASTWADGDLAIAALWPGALSHELDFDDNRYYPKQGTPGAGVAALMTKSSDQSLTTNTDDEITFQTTIYAYPSDAVSLTDNAFVAPVDGVYEAFVKLSTNSITTGSDFRMKAWIDDVAAETDTYWMARADMIDARYYWGHWEGEMSAGEKLTFTMWVTASDSLTIRGATAGQRTHASFKLVAT